MEFDFKEMEAPPCIFVGNKGVILSFDDELMLFAKEEGTSDAFYSPLDETLRVKDLGEPIRFLR